MKKWLFIALVVMSITCLALPGCAGPSTEPIPTTPPATKPETTPTPGPNEPQYGGTFIWYHNSGVTQIGAIADNLGTAANRNTYPALEPLLLTDAQDNLEPWLATEWKTSADGKTITLKLRENIKFHDGTPFNADAVKYNLEAVLKANITGTAFLTNVLSYDVPDDYTLRINLEESDSTFLLRIAQGALGMIASPTAMQKEATAENMAELHCVGTGPFKFDSWQRDSYVRYKRWDGYWQKGKPYLDAVEIRNTADLSVSIMSLRAGEVHAVANIDPVDAKQLASEGYDIYQPDLYFCHSIIPDGNNPESPFADKRVRMALEYALDKKTMAQGIGEGYYTDLTQMAVKADSWYNPNIEIREYNPARARELLAEAGYSNGFSTKLISDVMARRDTLVAVQTYLQEVGIKTELEILDFGAAFSKPRQGWDGILFPGFPNTDTLLGILGRFGDETNYISFYRPPEWQEKWDALVKELDTVKRTQQLKELITILHDEVIAIPYQGDAPCIVRVPYLHGFDLTSHHVAAFWAPQDVWMSQK